jgi:Flp pilus assembly protein TadG
MRLDKFGRRQHGQVVIILGLAFTAILGMMAFAIDLGFGMAHRREAQNAADDGALAGVQALARHYLYQQNGSTAGATDYTDAMILTEITRTAAADIPPFIDMGTVQSTATPTWPSGAGNSLTAYYLITTNGTITQGAQVGSLGAASPPASAAGVRVEAQLRAPTLFASTFGITNLNVYASARALLGSGGPSGNLPAPFIICGGGLGAAYRVKNADGTAPPDGTFDQLVTSTSPLTISSAFKDNIYLVHSSKLASPNGPSGGTAACGNLDSSFKGATDMGSSCTPTGSDSYPCQQPTSNGDQAGPISNFVAGYTGCTPTNQNNCVAMLAVTEACTSSSCLVLGLVPVYLMEGLPSAPRVNVSGCSASNCHTGTLLSGGTPTVICGGGCEPTGQPFDPSNPGIITYGLVPD